jgi:hypothetical protein
VVEWGVGIADDLADRATARPWDRLSKEGRTPGLANARSVVVRTIGSLLEQTVHVCV